MIVLVRPIFSLFIQNSVATGSFQYTTQNRVSVESNETLKKQKKKTENFHWKQQKFSCIKHFTLCAFVWII